MRRYGTLNAIVALSALGLALVAGAERRAAFTGVLASSLSAAIVLVATAAALRAKSPARALTGVISLSFLVRLILVAAGCALVFFRGGSPIAFCLGFFVPYVVFQALEIAFIASQARRQKEVLA